MRQLDRVKRELDRLAAGKPEGVEARTLADRLGLDRSTASRYLNELVRAGAARKVPGRPVRYLPAPPSPDAGSRPSLPDDELTPTDRMLLDEALAALLYPPHGLPILLTGETGSGKSWLAQKMAELASASGRLPSDASFVPFNCAEYAHNPELLLAQLFGVKKGAFTGADSDRPGLVEQAAGGVLFLDEVHRLPPAGQEMLFHLIDRGTYRRLGETGTERQAAIRLVAATTESPETALIPALRRRFSTVLAVPPLRERPPAERFQLLEMVLAEEERKMGLPLEVDEACRHLLLRYDCPGNIGQLKSDIRIACARSFLRSLKEGKSLVRMRPEDLPAHAAQAGAVTLAARQALHLSGEDVSDSSGEPAGIYEQLARRRAQLFRSGADETTVTRELERMAEAYIRELLAARSDGSEGGIPGDSPLLRVLRKAARQLEPPFSGMLNDERLMALSLHLQSFLRRRSRGEESHKNPGTLRPDPASRTIADRLADHLRRELDIRLPESEIELISFFFSQSGSIRKPRTIAVVCLTGEGAARSIESWLRERLPAADRDVEVRAVSVDPATRRSPDLDKLAAERRLIAVTGTAEPALVAVPYIPVWELYNPRGWDRLRALLEQSRLPEDGREAAPLDHRDIPALLLRGLEETVVHYNPRLFVSLLERNMDTFRNAFGWEAEREAGVWMHLAIFTDRLLDEQLRGIPAESLPDKKPVPAAAAGSPHPLWSRLLAELEERLAVRYPPGSAAELTRLSGST